MTPAAPLLLARRSRWRWPLALAAVVNVVAHVPVIGPHLSEAPYLAGLFALLITGCAVIAVAAVVCDSTAVYRAAIMVCGSAITAYLASRTIAFPGMADDVGNWLEPLGVLAIVAELVAVVSAFAALTSVGPTSDAVIMSSSPSG